MRLLHWIILALATSCTLATNPVEEQVLKTIDEMEAAVMSGDAGAYMASVYPGDEVFLTEQRAWFMDLKRNPVSDFEIEPVGAVRLHGLNGWNALLDVKVHWTLKSDGIDRTYTYKAHFTRNGWHMATPNASWLYSGIYWDGGKYPRDGVRPRICSTSSNQELANGVYDCVPDIQGTIERNLDLKLSSPLTVKIYPDMQALQYSIAPGYINPISGWNEPGESIKILSRDDVSAERISSLLAHEIGHAVSFEFGDQTINAPWWSLEGIAELVADEYRSTPPEKRIVRIAKQVAQGDRRTWDQLSDFKGEALNHSRYVYSQGWSMVRYITMSFGKKARNAWFTEMGQGASVEEATQSALKISFDDLDRAWEAEMISIAEQAED